MNSNSVLKQLVAPILVITFAVLLTAGFMYGLRQLTGTQPALAPVAVTPSPTPVSPASAPTLIEPAEIPDDWLTYRNEEFGFEVRYPGGLTISETDGKYADIIISDFNHVTIAIDTRINAGESLLSWCNLQSKEDFARKINEDLEKFKAEYYTLNSAGIAYPAEQFVVTKTGNSIILVKHDFNKPITLENENMSRWGQGWHGLIQNSEGRNACLDGDADDLTKDEFLQILSHFQFLQ
jgi:hypothetical protein